MIKFVIEKVADENTGQLLDSVVKKEDGKPDDVWCSVMDLDKLFESCVNRWGSNWNLEKVIVAIVESEID